MEQQKYMPVTVNPIHHEPTDYYTATTHPIHYEPTNNHAAPAYAPPTKRQRNAWSKIGSYALFVLILGTIAIILAFICITFLWKGVGATSGYAGSNLAAFWRKVMVNAWIARAVTLLSLVIRIAVAAQAGICTSMLAALLFERSGVPLSRVAEISLIRSSNSGPHHLAGTVLPALSRFRAPMFTAVLFIMVLTTLLSQFTSTALLSDLRPGMIVMETNVVDVAYGKRFKYAMAQVYQGIDYWATKPSFYPAFAEYSEASVQTDDSFYTGRVNRAMPPFSEPDQRTLMHSYKGLATVANMATVCVRPSIEASLPKGSMGGFNTPRVVGRVSGSPSEKVLKENPSFASINEEFNCTLPTVWLDELGDPRSLKEWPVGLCRLQGTGDVSYGGPFLMLNLTRGDWESWMGLRGTEFDVKADRAEGVWQHMTSPTAGVDFSISLCWTDGNIGTENVDISSTSPRTEPALSWTIGNEDYNSSAIRAQLGTTTGASKRDRGVLDLDPNFNVDSAALLEIITFEHLAVRANFEPGITAGMCAYCKINDKLPSARDFWAHRGQIAVFQDILTSTRNPGLALQAQYFTLLAMAHYDMQPEMDVTAAAEVSFFREVVMPRAWNGFIGVVLVLVVHLVCVGVSVTLFVTRTQFTLLGNTWSAVGQILESSPACATVAATSAMETDDEVRKRMGDDRSVVVLGGAMASGSSVTG